jgi:hypothetical protein
MLTTALGGPAHDRVLHPVPGKDAERAVVHLDGQRHEGGAARLLDDLEKPGVDLEHLRGFVELRARVLERIQLLLDIRTFGGHQGPPERDAVGCKGRACVRARGCGRMRAPVTGHARAAARKRSQSSSAAGRAARGRGVGVARR